MPNEIMYGDVNRTGKAIDNLWDSTVLDYDHHAVEPHTFSKTEIYQNHGLSVNDGNIPEQILLISDSDSYKALVYVTEQMEDITRFQITAGWFMSGSKKISPKHPLTFQCVLDDGWWVISNGPFDIMLTAETKEELRVFVYQELEFLWRQYAMEDENVLDEGARHLKYQLLDFYKESD
ncbi:MAG: hypothetical protein F4132_12930 [Gemmatimonadetes bacterium]|nr:hypothetical protein [Gemmatimonadota bacterium]MYH19997.1 hypothetical protein [Gemmatimonadota bacterium]